MIQSIIALIFIGLLVRKSLRANARHREHRRLPMQWWLDGSVNWTAPRVWALTLTPVLASCALAAVVAMTLFLAPRPGQEGFEIPVVVFMGLVFIGAHAFHLWMIDRSLKQGGG